MPRSPGPGPPGPRAMSPAWRSAPALLGLLGGLTVLLLCPPAVRGDCSHPPDLPNAEPALEGRTSFPTDSSVTYECNKGFVKVPGKPDTVFCLKSDKWSEITEFCNRSCEFPPRLYFASLQKPYSRQNYFPVGSTVEYECHSGYKRNHSLSGKLTCLPSLTWSKPAEFCKKKSCPNPGEFKNGHVNITTNILFGSPIFFSCDKGYTLVGAAISYCSLVEQNVGWSDPLPECKQIFCPDPPKIDNGKIQEQQPNYVDGQSITYTCTEGFVLTGKNSIQCVVKDDQGEWSGQPPVCKESSPTVKFPPAVQKPTVKVLVTEAPPTPQRPTIVKTPVTEAPTPQKLTTVKASGTEGPPTPQKPATVKALIAEAPSAPQKPATVKAPVTETPPGSQKPTIEKAPITETPTPQKSTTVNASGTEGPLIPQKPTTVNDLVTEDPPTPHKPTTEKTTVTETPTPQKPTAVNASGIETAPTLQKPTIEKGPVTEATPTPQKPTLVNASGIETPPTPQKPTLVNASGIETAPTLQKPTIEKGPVTEATPTPQKPTLVNASGIETPPTPQKPTLVNASGIETPPTPQKPTLVNASGIETQHAPQKLTTESATKAPATAQKPPVLKTLSTKTPSAALNPVKANASATQATATAPKFSLPRASSTHSLPATQKSTTVHVPVTKGHHTTQRIFSSHVTATRSLTVPRTTTPSHTTSIPKGRGTLSSGTATLIPGFVAGTIIIGSLILVKIFWDRGKSGTYIYNTDCFAYDASNHWLAVLAEEELRRKCTQVHRIFLVS
ncbi:complement decay-accelerating factor isoform X2 [Tamandua tetradactyla]|uniref:complement decay-accelerating factor isoform X2 n=1 Tax=Tamandua tetradactyla TaxID=48850 RepID=UPI004053DB01